MFSVLFNAYQQALQMMVDSSKVLNQRLPLLYSPSASHENMGIHSWFDMWGVSQEKIVAYQQAFWIFQTEIANINQTDKTLTRQPASTDNKTVKPSRKKPGASLEASAKAPQYSLL